MSSTPLTILRSEPLNLDDLPQAPAYGPDVQVLSQPGIDARAEATTTLVKPVEHTKGPVPAAGVKAAVDAKVQRLRDLRSAAADRIHTAVANRVPNFKDMPPDVQSDVREIISQGLGWYSGGLLQPGPATEESSLEHPLTSTVPPIGIREMVEGEGLKYKGELVKGSGVHMVEHPNHPGKTAAVDEPITADKVHAAVARKLSEMGADPDKLETERQFFERQRGQAKDFSSVEGHVERVPAEEKFRQENQIHELRDAQNRVALKRILKEDRARREAEFEKAQPKPAAAPAGSEQGPSTKAEPTPAETSAGAETFFDKEPVYQGPTGKPHDFSSVKAKQVRPAKVKQAATPPIVREGYYNTIEHVVQNKLGERFTPEQLEATLKNSGVPKQELEPLMASVRSEAGPVFEGQTNQLNKADVLGHLDRNRLRLDVVTKGGDRDTTGVAAARYRLADEQARLRVELQQLERRSQTTDGEEYAEFQNDPEHGTTRLAAVRQRLGEIKQELDTDDFGDPKYEQYTLPGGTNYREVLLRQDKEAPDITGKPGEGYAARRRRIEGEEYHSPHFDEPNILAHLRLKDRVDTHGLKTLFMEEAQSDWAHDATPEAREGPEGPTVPRFPLGKDWHELALKHALKEAVDGGYDSLSWTTGQQQAERYNLAKTVDHLAYQPWKDTDQGSLAGFKDGKQVFANLKVTPDELRETVGKDVADKLLATERTANNIMDPNETGANSAYRKYFGEYPTHQLKIDKSFGGESHKHLYDEMIPQFLNKYTKRWGGKVGTTEVETAAQPPTSSEQIMAGKASPKKIETVHTLPITPELREAVKAGQPMFGAGVKEPAPVTSRGPKPEESKPETSKPPVSVPPEVSTGKYDSIIKAAGAVPGGIEKGDPEDEGIYREDRVLFHDPETGSTAMLPVTAVTPERVAVELSKVRRQFGKEAGFIGERTPGPKRGTRTNFHATSVNNLNDILDEGLKADRSTFPDEKTIHVSSRKDAVHDFGQFDSEGKHRKEGYAILHINSPKGIKFSQGDEPGHYYTDQDIPSEYISKIEIFSPNGKLLKIKANPKFKKQSGASLFIPLAFTAAAAGGALAATQKTEK